MTAPATISERRLTLSYLSRQLLLERSRTDCAAAVRRLVGLQGQYSPSPYLALLARLEGFAAQDLEACLAARSVVKATLMRGTLHLAAAEDFAAYAEIYRVQSTAHWLGRYPGLDPDAVVRRVAAAAREGCAGEELADLVEAAATGVVERRRDRLHIARGLVPLVQVPPAGYWRWHGNASFSVWTEPAPVSGPEAVGRFLRAYLTAYGPASPADAARFAGLRVGAMKAGIDHAGPLERLTGPDGRALLDVPDAPWPDDDVRAPFRLLPKWDSALLAHDVRARIIDADLLERVVNRANGDVAATYLIDGRVAGLWTSAVEDGTAVLTLHPLSGAPIPDDAEREAELLLGFAHPEAAKRRIAVTESNTRKTTTTTTTTTT
jgi:hypothetical protein